jgi:hypothetical protein
LWKAPLRRLAAHSKALSARSRHLDLYKTP